jgi:phosphoribosylformylglycinamidine (FGAM) synthase-like enzyme
LKEPGDVVYLLGTTLPEFGGSHFNLIQNFKSQSPNPKVPTLPDYAPTLYRALHQAICAGLVRACHDLSEGGLAVAAAEMCIGGRLGLALNLEASDPVSALFSESNGRLLVEVRRADCAAFEAHFAGALGAQIKKLGLVMPDARLDISTLTQALINLAVPELVKAWIPAI